MVEAITITPDAQLACVRRELAMRKNVYPKWVTAKRMSQEKADHEIAAMQAVHDVVARHPAVVAALRGQVILTVTQPGLTGDKPVAYQCDLCNTEWKPDEAERHAATCPLHEGQRP